MFTDHKTTNKYLALFTFLVSLIIYCLTIAPTASFWDAGEFIAVAHGLQVNHPPGAPFYSLLGRIFSMFMPTSYVALSINFISALSSALTIMLLYLIIVRLIREWKGHPDEMLFMDKIGMYGGALVGALTFAVTDTFWFSAVEAEVYALSMFFTAIVVWLTLKWSENHDKLYNERWLVLIAYMFGIAIGVHLLNLLALFFVALIVYFKKYEFSYKSFLLMGAISILIFFSIYPFTIQTIPTIANGIDEATYGLIQPLVFIFLVMVAVAWGVWYTHKKKHRLTNIILICYTMILIGFSSYSVIMIRSIADPPIDENDPENTEAFISYLKREQYGSTPILKGNNFDSMTGQINHNTEKYFPRRYSPDPRHLDYYTRYSSDWNYFWDYQVNHMYVRYFNWNFIGREADIQGADWQSGFKESPYPDNFANNAYFFIPFLLGFFGLIFHFSSDWQRAFAVLALFIVTGLAIIVFLNQTPYQPRERDYAYVGSFFAFSIWIGLGVTGLVDLLKNYTNENKLIGYATVLLCLIASPVWMASQNWDDHDRSNRYIAPDYAHNLLNSVAPNAILFTNGDNDTFPLWYLQEVEGVRTDVRIANLSLLNTDWYIKQLRDQWSHESAPLPISLTDEEVDRITSGLTQWQPREIQVPVDKQMLAKAFSEDSFYKEAIGVIPDTTFPILQKGTDFEMPVDSLDNVVAWRVNGRQYGQDQQGNTIYYLQTQDHLILDILQTNKWLRPVYFANTVSSQSQLNLSNYFRIEGKAYRVVPKNFGAGSGHIKTEIYTDRLESFKFREWNDPDLYLDENIRRMLSNYRYNFMQLAMKYREEANIDSAAYWLKWGEERIPFREDEENQSLKLLYAIRYLQTGLGDDATRLAATAVEKLQRDLQHGFDAYNNVVTKFELLNQEFERARISGNIKKQRGLRAELTALNERAESTSRNIVPTRQGFVLVQYIYYQTDNADKAEEMASWVDETLGATFPPMPNSKSSSEQEVKRYGLH